MNVDSRNGLFYVRSAKTVRFAPNENSGIFVAGELRRPQGVSRASGFRD